MKEYVDLLKKVLHNGDERTDRTGVGTLSIFGEQLRFDLGQAFPLVTTKKVHWKSVVYELLWFIRGDTNVRWLQEHGVSIWNEWADESGNLGKIYGKQWRDWGGKMDQLHEVIEQIKHNPTSRRMIVSSWNVSELDEMALPPCHLLYQFYVSQGRLSCQVYQRSCDVFLGLPFNIASYALLTMMVAHVCGLQVGELVMSLGDVHLYQNHVEQAKIQIERTPKALPKVQILRDVPSIDDFRFEDFALVSYEPHPKLVAEVAV